MSAWEVLLVTYERGTGKPRVMLCDWFNQLSERQARKLAWSMDCYPSRRSVRVRPAGSASDDIGEPHDWPTHAPAGFFT